MKFDKIPDGKGKKLLKQPIMLIVVTIFLFIGFYTKVWHPTWVILLSIPLYYYFAIRLITPNNKYISAIPLFVALGLIYVVLGLTLKIWHPTWLIFIVGVIIYWNKIIEV